MVRRTAISGVLLGCLCAVAASCSSHSRTASEGAAESVASALTSSVLDRTVSTEIGPATAFLYTGTSPVQTGVAAGTIVPRTAAVVRGRVLSPANTGLAGVAVTVVGHPEFGTTTTQSDGTYDLAVNGGQALRLRYKLGSYLPVDRLIQVPQQNYAVADDVALVALDTQVTTVTLSWPSMQVARGTSMTDSSGTRRATLLVPPNTTATMTDPNGNPPVSLTTMKVRATEYSVGTNGYSALPGSLPAMTSYAYALELSADEAIAAGATELNFSQPLALYVENFLNFPVGASIPSGSYDAAKGAWVGSSTGIILQVLSVTGGAATVDVDGDGAADTGTKLTALGITSGELQQLGNLYTAPQKLWRTPIPHFSGYTSGPNPGSSTAPQATKPCIVPSGDTPCIPYGNNPTCGSNPPACAGGSVTLTCCGNGDATQCHFSCCPTGYGASNSPSGSCNTSCYLSTGTCDSAPPPPPDPDGPQDCHKNNASTIACQRQSLGEDFPLVATPYSLHYESDRQRGHVPRVTIPFTTRSTQTAIQLRVNVAGRQTSQTLGTSPPAVFDWDEKDAYGRLLQGSQPVQVDLVYQYTSDYEKSVGFGVPGAGTGITGTTRRPFEILKRWNGMIEFWDAQAQGLGGWNVNVHHVYDVSGQILRLGDGTNRTLRNVPAVIQTAAGNGLSVPPAAAGGSIGDGGPATSATVAGPRAVAVGADGSFYIASQNCVRKVTPDGIIQTFAGQCTQAGFSGDGLPATSALMQTPQDIAFGPDGSLYIADTTNHRIRRVSPSGTITTVAGSGTFGFAGDGGPATQAALNNPTGVDLASDGTMYIADRDNGRIRQVAPTGIIATLAGTGFSTASTGTGGPATAATLGQPVRVRVGPDGSIFIAEKAGHLVRRIGSEGIIHAVAGTGIAGSSAEGFPATTASLNGPLDIAFGPDGSLYIVDGTFTVRRVTPSGIISTVAGRSGQGSFTGDNGVATAATLGLSSQGIRVGPDGNLYIASTASNRVRRVQLAFGRYSSPTSGFRIPSEDGKQIFVFDGNGRHLQTLYAFTGTPIYTFSYDAAGRLSSIAEYADATHTKVTQFVRDTSGNLQKVVAPSGSTSVFTPDPNGYLATASDPNYPVPAKTTFTYYAGGLMKTKTNPNGGQSTFTYDALGRLDTDKDAANATISLVRSDFSGGSQVTMTSGEGIVTTLNTLENAPGAYRRETTLPDGVRGLFERGPVSTTVSKGGVSTVTTTETPDPRPGFGMLSPVSSVTTKLPSGLSRTVTTTRSATYAAAGNLIGFNEQTNLNGNTWTNDYAASTQTWTLRSPANRTQTMVVDAVGRPTKISVPGVSDVVLNYDTNGLLSKKTQGSRVWQNYYTAEGWLSQAIDPLGIPNSLAWNYDAAGHVTGVYLPRQPSGDTFHLGYDANANVKYVMTPGPQHDLTYTSVDLLDTYTPPVVPGVPAPATKYVYNLDRKLKTTTRPDGITLTNTYDPTNGRLQTTAQSGAATGTLTYGYTDTGAVKTITTTAGQALTYAYDGPLKTGVTWSGSGLIAGSLTMGYNSNFMMTSQKVNTETPLIFGYDVDGLPNSAGLISISRDPSNGRLTGTTLGAVTDAYTYDTFGYLATYTAKYNGGVVYAENILARDGAGRITSKQDTVQSTTTTWDYTYDVRGRLVSANKNGVPVSQYGYLQTGNRMSANFGNLTATYDAQDRLMTYGNTSYTYTANGELKTSTTGSSTTSYTYDAFGNLTRVVLPSTTVDYIVDGENRRVGKKVGGTFANKFLYQDALNVIAELDVNGNVKARFVFGSKSNVPDYFTSSNGTFRILSDHLGSPRVVINTSTGVIAERIDYDEFGVVLNDTAPGLIPFGFAGGLYDQHSKLVRFGARDYDPSVGRWTSKDPIGFAGGDFTLYAYVSNDPINRIDPRGLDPCGLVTTTGGIVVCYFVCILATDFTGLGCNLVCGLGAYGIGDSICSQPPIPRKTPPYEPGICPGGPYDTSDFSPSYPDPNARPEPYGPDFARRHR